MSTQRTCGRCGAVVSSSAPDGLCLHCLLDAASEADPQIEPTKLDQAQAAEEPDSALRTPHSALGTLGRFGDYELLEEVARGGMGVVYRARQISLDRVVAVKMLLFGPLASKEFIQRFRVEASAAAGLQHPNIVAVHEVGVHQNQHYLVMEYIAGQTLSKLSGGQPLPPRRAAAYMKTIAEAIHFAHERGVLHRDLKPSNVLIDLNDEPHVTDFGLAKRLDADSDLTLSGQLLGSPNYMSPEQAMARRGKVGRSSDVYSLGALLFHLLTGRPPFVAETAPETIQLVLEREPVTPRVLVVGVPRDLETICLKSLEKDRAKRYQTAQELSDDLGRFLNDEPILARPITRVERAWRWCRRKPALASALLLLLLLVLVVVIGAPITAYRINQERQKAEARAYTSDINVVLQAWEDGNLRRAQALLRAHIPKPRQPDLRGFEWRYLWKLCQDESPFSFTNFPAEVRFALSPDGSLLAAGSGPIVRLLDHANGRELDMLRLPAASPGLTALAFMPADTNVLATASQKTLHFWNLSERRITRTLILSNSVVALAFSRDGKLLAAAHGDETGLELWRVEDRSLAWMRNAASPLQALAFTPDGKSLISGGGELSELLQWDLTTGISLPFPAEHQGTINAVEFSPDGQLMATSGNDSTVILWDLKERRLLARLIARGTDQVRPAKFSPDGRWLVTGHDDATVRLWDVSTRQQKAIYRGHQSSVLSVAFSADGRSILSSSADRTLKAWDIEPRSPEVILTTSKGWVRTSLFSPNSKQLLTRTIGEDRITVWDVATGSRLADLGTPGIATGPAAFSPNGETLVMVSGRRIALWDTATFASRGSWTNDFDPISLAFTPDSQTLAVSGQQVPGIYFLRGVTNRLTLWDLTTRRKINKLAVAAPRAMIVTFSHDGSKVAIGYLHGEVRVWDYATERLLAEFTDQRNRIWSVAFSPDDAWLVAGGFDGAVVFHDLRALRTFRSIQTSTWILGLCFTPDGRTFASSEGDGTIKLWNFATREIALVLKGHVGPGSMDPSFSPDGRFLATSGSDGTVRLWPAATWEEIATSQITK